VSVSDKTAVITGAGSKRGIGRATAHTLAAAGWNVAVLDLDEASAKDAAHEVAERNGVQAVGIGCDITDETSVENAVALLDGALPPVGALVNNAGITSPTPCRSAISVAASLALASSRSRMATFQPAAARVWAVARPMPRLEPAPVTMAVLSETDTGLLQVWEGDGYAAAGHSLQRGGDERSAGPQLAWRRSAR
jgi:NAD(P)-dependent dehydrogenase (short-subunit alcohol dehydrogenase family)